MQWLGQTREALRAKEVNLKSSFEFSPGENEIIGGFIRSTRQIIESLGSGAMEPKIRKLADGYCKNLERAVGRVYKGARRAAAKGQADIAPLTPAEIGEIHNEYQEHVDYLLSLSESHTPSVYKKASTSVPFWKAAELREQLTDEKIMEALSGKGIMMTQEETREAFPKGVRLRFAVNNISDPLEAIGRVAGHMRETLTDEKIMEALLKKGITMTQEETREAFPKGVRLHFAVNNISDPLEAIGRVAGHMRETLTDEKIMEALSGKGITMTQEETREAFPKGVRLHFAVGNISDPLEAIGRVAGHMKETLTDGKIMGALLKKGITMTQEETREAFPKGVRLYFAVHNLSDPLEACVRYAKGEVAYGGRFYRKN